ncbi:MAG: STAS domain-containing protein [Clostridia bacterium]|nr:STAS domain-containing protein [Clostridia bacterium]
MEIIKKQNENTLELALIGRLDTTTAPQLEGVMAESLDGVTLFILDFEKLEYISSAGLRLLLVGQKRMNKQGSMVLRHVNSDINDVLEITGFSDILTIE